MKPSDWCTASVFGIHIVNVHLSNNKEKFKKQSLFITDELKKEDKPCCVMGDFNALLRFDGERLAMFNKSSVTYDIDDVLHVFEFNNKLSVSDTGSIPSTYKCRIISTQMNKIFQTKCGTIDGIFVVDSNSSVISSAVHGVNGPMTEPELMQYTWPSDHYLLLSKVNIKGVELTIGSWNVLGESVSATESFNIFEFLPMAIQTQYSDKLPVLREEMENLIARTVQSQAHNPDFNINRVSEVLRSTVEKSYLDLFNTHFILPFFEDDSIPADSPFNTPLYRRLRDTFQDRLRLFNEQANESEKLYGRFILQTWEEMVRNQVLAEFFKTWFAYITTQSKLTFGDILFKYLRSKSVDIIGLQEVNTSMVEYLRSNEQTVLELGYKIHFGEFTGNTCGVIISVVE